MFLKKLFVSLFDFFDQNLFRWLVKLFYPQYKRPRKLYEALQGVVRFFLHAKNYGF